MGKREDHKTRTREALATAAVELFLKKTYDTVTVGDVADAVGVSRRTAYRYFPTKDEMVMFHPNRWLEVFDSATNEHADLPTGARLRQASHTIAAHIENDPEPVRKAFAVAASHPSLAAAYAANTARWIDRVASEIDQDDKSTPEAAVRARILAAAVMGMIDKVCLLWAEGDQPMSPLIDMGFDFLASAFDQGEK